MKKVMTTKKIIALCLLVIALVTFTKCAEEFVSPPIITGITLVDLAAADTTLQIFTAALEKTGIGISLDNINSGQHTVFAPTDSAFRVYFQPIIGGNPGDEAIAAYINTLSSSTNPRLADFTARLQYHVISSEVMSDAFTLSQVFTTIQGSRLSLSDGSTVAINANTVTNGGKIRTLDIDGANGVMHTVSRFLNQISTANFYVGTTGLGITVNYSIAPPAVTNTAPPPAGGAATGPAANYEIFSKAIIKTKMATTLRPNVSAAFLPDFTIFLPLDAAMVTYLGTLSGGTVTNEATAKTFIDGLAENDPKLATLTDIVKYHVANGRVLSTDLVVDQSVTTLLTGKTFTVKPGLTLQDLNGASSDATISNPNNLLTNAGIIHGINAVLIPN